MRRKKEAERQQQKYLLSMHLGHKLARYFRAFPAWSAGRQDRLSIPRQRGLLNA